VGPTKVEGDAIALEAKARGVARRGSRGGPSKELPEEPEVHVDRRASFEDVEEMLSVRLQPPEGRATREEPLERDPSLG
jgi:hypothetical protein